MEQICANCKYWSERADKGAYHECTKHHFNTGIQEYAEYTIAESGCDDFKEKDHG